MSRERHEFAHSSKWISYLFILFAVLPLLLIIPLLIWVVPHLGGFSVSNFWTDEGNLQLLKLRAPYIIQAFGNLILYLTACACGALLYSKRWAKTGKGCLILAAISGIAAFFLHSMVWGIDLFIPSTYSLFSLHHRSLMLFAAVQASLYVHGAFIDNLLSVVIHVFAPQVLIPAAVFILSVRKYKKTAGIKPV